MFTSSIINQDALETQINNEVERLTAIRFEAFKDALLAEIAQNYYFDDCFLSREEVALKLGISIGTVDNLRKRGKIKNSNIGSGVKYKKSEILRYMKTL
jgi:predicted DNA-binding transcriptional regulator AlpA